MKTHTKTTLQELVFELMAPGQRPLADGVLNKWLNQLPKIGREMIMVMRLIMFGNLKHKLVCRHLGQIRKECTLMLDALYQYPEFPDSMKELYQNTVNCLEMLLEFQQVNYADYLDQRVQMPFYLYRKKANEIAEGVDGMLDKLSKGGVDQNLQAIIAGKMATLLSRETGSYGQISCLLTVQQWVMQLSANELNNGITKRLLALLKKVNFSSEGFKHYCKQQQNDKPAAPVLQQRPENYRIAVTCSIDALAYLFKLLIAAGLVMAEPKSQLFRFITASFKTPGIGQESISAHSFTNKYNQAVQATAKTVRAVLVRMLKILDKEFDLA